MKIVHLKTKGAAFIAAAFLAGCSGAPGMLPGAGAMPDAQTVHTARSATPILDENGGDARTGVDAAIRFDAASPIKLSSATLALLSTGSVSAKPVTVTEKGYSGKFTEKTTCKNIATALPASGHGPTLKVTVTALKAGSCTITFADTLKHSAVLAVTDTTAVLAISASSVSSKTASVTIKLVSVNGKKPVAKLQTTVTANLAKCAAGCKVAGPQAPAGTDVFSLVTFDTAGGKGNQLATGTTSFKVVAAKANSIAVTLAKIPKFLSFGSIPTAVAGTAYATPQSLALSVQDADHVAIAGTYSAAVTVTDSDTSSLTQGSALVVNGGSASRSVQLKSSSNTLALAYGGLAIAPVTLAAAATGAAGANGQFAPESQPIVYSGPEDAGSPEIDLYNPTSGQPGYSGAFTATQPGWSGTPFNNNFTYTLGGSSNNCSSFAVSPASGTATAYTVAVGASPVAGTCVLTIAGASSGTTQKVLLTYTSNSIGINAKRRPH